MYEYEEYTYQYHIIFKIHTIDYADRDRSMRYADILVVPLRLSKTH